MTDKATINPHYKHDCDQCTYLGPFKEGDRLVDLYWCDEGAIGDWTLIVRRSDEPADYSSAPSCVPQMLPCHREAFIRAAMRGLIPESE